MNGTSSGMNEQPEYSFASTYFTSAQPIQLVPRYFNLISNALDKLKSFKVDAVKKQAENVLINIAYFLSIYPINLDNKFNKILITELEDSSAMIEWIFDSFRIGFSLEADPHDASYFFVSNDKSTGIYNAYSKPLNDNIQELLSAVVGYVIGNT
jgi:hypothetical protein